MESSDRLSNSERAEIARQLAEGWRFRCPRGHASLQGNVGPTVYCGMCNEGYHYADLVDASEPGNTVTVTPPSEGDR